MAAKHSHHVALTAAHAEYVVRQVAEGRYASVSEVVRAGLRLLIERGEVKLAPPARGTSTTRRDA